MILGDIFVEAIAINDGKLIYRLFPMMDRGLH
jgi:hypothetical protein